MEQELLWPFVSSAAASHSAQQTIFKFQKRVVILEGQLAIQITLPQQKIKRA